MTPQIERYAEHGVQLLEAALHAQPPPQVSAAFVSGFFAQYRQPLQDELAQLLVQVLSIDHGEISASPIDEERPALPVEIPTDTPPDLWPVAARTAANLEAIRLLARGQTQGESDRQALLRYSGWGGLSVERVASQLPEGFRPERRGLIHEFYTPTAVAREIARVLRPLIPGLPQHDERVLALEPSAGIGRMVHACSGPGFEALRWTAVEYSQVSSRLLAAVRPDIEVFAGPFERWVAENEAALRGKLGLVVSNPPYGARGASLTEDADRGYRERKAYAYFMRRALDLLAGGGVGVFLVPYGFLTGRTPALMALREKILRRHHLMAAYRLPSHVFPGVSLVIDVLFFRARGGELSSVLPDDLPLLQGRYFELFPAHILGTERGTASDDEDTTRKPRRGYEVDGTFTALPDVIERPQCVTCTVTPFYRAVVKAPRRSESSEALPEHLQAAAALGDRVAHFLTTLSKGDADSLRQAHALHAELRDALTAWVAARVAATGTRVPHLDRDLQVAARTHASLVSFLSAFEDSGALVPALREPPVYEPRYQGAADDIAAQADFLHRTQRHLTLDMLRAFRRQHGIADLNEPLHTPLITAGWCFDRGEWIPSADYYSGALWPKYDRAKSLADQGDAQAAAQAARLLDKIRPTRFADIAPEPRMPWVTLDILRAWLEEWTDSPVPPLVRDGGLLKLEESTYTHLKDVAEQRLTVAIGYLNHDFTLFRPPTSKQVNAATGEEESAEQALGRARVEYGERARRSFLDFVSVRPELSTQIEEGYNRTFRGYVLPQYGADELPIARWRGRITLKAHQRAGAQRLVAHNGGLLGFDVGVGKTYTGIATIAALRQQGRAKRPIVVVPNTIIWKWHKEIRAALPDYRVLVVGSERYIGKSGVYTSRIDSPQERALKWRQFQAGEFDVALVTYSTFARNRVRAESVRNWVVETPALLRQIGLDARSRLAAIKEGKEEDGAKRKKRRAAVSLSTIEKAVGAERARELTEEQRQRIAEEIALQREKERDDENDRLLKLLEGITDLSERERAIVQEGMERWIAERIELNEEPDPGIYWEDLQCDLLVLDEAQNMKNLWPVQPREGGVPKYLGAISEGSDRAWNFAIRAALVRARTGGSGVVLLSATPAKNSPLEYYTLLGYVDGEAWTRLGITDPEVFIDRYLRLELKDVIGSDLKTQRRTIVAGFQNLDELRDVVFRYAEFRTAEEVGLTLPETQVEQVRVPMSDAQLDKYEQYLADYEQAIKRGKEDPKMRLKALGLLQRMALIAIHAELDSGPLNREGRAEWTWSTARQVRDPSCPKLARIVALILQKPDCGHLVFCDNVAVHAWLVMLLTQAGFPQDRIAVFNADQAPNPARRQLLAERFNGVAPVLDDAGRVEQEGIAPQYDVVIANATAYEGIDLHVRTCQVYHIDLPWEPATLQQRNGRAVRQGNLQAVIRIFYLLSERSMDAVRFSMILGKLNWMKDILTSADRETNNPGAQAEMNPEELLLYLARDPEQAKAAIEEQRRMQAEETQARVRRQAWTSLRGIATRAQSLQRVTDAAQRGQIQREMDELRGYLAQVPSETWPWFFLADVALLGTPMLFGADYALVQGSGIWREGAGIELGEIRIDTIGVRRFGEHRWQALTTETLAQINGESPQAAIKALIESATPDDVRMAFSRWPLAEDRAQLEPLLRRSIAALRDGDFGELGLDLASPGWRGWLWAEHGAEILAALRTAPRSMAFRFPAQRDDGSLALLYGEDLAGREAAVLPFRSEEFAGFTERAITSGYKWGELQATAMAWWSRPFPRGILREAEPELQVEIRTAQGTRRVRAVWQSPHFAVTYAQGRGADHPDGPQYNVTHLASGMAAAQAFPSREGARVAAQYLESLPTNWGDERPNTAVLPRNLAAMLAWIRAQREPPTLSQIAEQAAG